MHGRLTALGAAGALMISLTACAGGSPSTAAVVDGHRITTGEVTRATDAYNRVSSTLAAQEGQQARALPEAVVLNALMRGEAAAAVARQKGQSVDGAADAMIATDPDLAAYVADPATKTLFRSLARTEALGQLIGTQAVEPALKSVKVQINPRYGLTDLTQIAQDPQTGLPKTRSNSLSQQG